jgi:hypothetical protein
MEAISGSSLLPYFNHNEIAGKIGIVKAPLLTGKFRYRNTPGLHFVQISSYSRAR